MKKTIAIILIAALLLALIPSFALAETAVTPTVRSSLLPGRPSSAPIYTVTGDSKVIPVKISDSYSGIVRLYYVDKPRNTDGTPAFHLNFFRDEACTECIDMDSDVPSFAAEKGKTYYIKIVNTSIPKTTIKIAFELIQYKKLSTTTLSSGKTITDCSYEEKGGTSNHKISITKTGYISITAKSDNADSLHFGIKNTKTKAVERYVDDFILQSGATEYIAVNPGTYSIESFDDECVFSLKYTFVSFALRTNTTKKTAVSLSKGKNTTVTSYRKDKSSWYHWYKIKLTKKQTVKIPFISSGNPFSIRMYNASSKSISLKRNLSYYSSTKELAAGTYYIKVYQDYVDDPADDDNPLTASFLRFYWK